MWERGARKEEISRQKEQHTQMSRNKSARRASEELKWDWGCMWRCKWLGLKWHSIKWLYFNLFLIKNFLKKSWAFRMRPEILIPWRLNIGFVLVEPTSCLTDLIDLQVTWDPRHELPCVSSGAYTGVGCSWCLKIYIAFTWLLW